LKAFLKSLIIFFCSASFAFAAIEQKQKVSTISTDHVLNWSLGLVIVLALFFTFIWFMKKMGALPVNAKDGMKVVAGLTLGMREKIILVQIGEKQLVLAVTPGRVEKLLLLEGEDTLFQQAKEENIEADFSQKLKQIMSGGNR